MDRNQFTGLILMFGLLVAYFAFFAPEPPPPSEEKQVTEQGNQSGTILTEDNATSANPILEEDQLPDSARQGLNQSKFGAFAFAITDNEEKQMISNDELEITFTSKGGRITSVKMRNHNSYLGDQLVIMREKISNYDYELQHQGKPISISALSFVPEVLKTNDTTIVTYTLKNEAFHIIHEYKIPKEGFEVYHKVESSGLNGIADPQAIKLDWVHPVTRAENNLEDSRYNCNVRYYLTSEDYEQLKERSTDFEEEQINEPFKWFSFKQKFFSIGLIVDNAFKEGYVTSNVDYSDTSTVKNLTATLTIPYTDYLSGFTSKFYFGPNKYDVLKKVAPGFSENLDMGWGPLPIVNKFLIIPIFHFFESKLANYGLIILLVVIVIRIILSPLTYRSHMSMAKMRVMKPELDEIKKKHKDDMQKAQQEQMQLYQKVGINPLSGCIPLLLQMPILFSLFFFFPNAVELRQASFLWAHDLSTYDSIINLPFEVPFYGDHVSLFTILMTASTLLITAVNSQQMTQMEGPMKTMQYIMPVMFLFVLNSYAAGLTFYYFVSNMATFGQTVLFRNIVNEEKIKKVLEENRMKNKDKKKSRFQSRLEEAMKASQEAQKKQKRKK